MKTRFIKVSLALLPIIVSACSQKFQAEPILSAEGDNTGLLTNITCDNDNFAFSLEKQKTGLFQIYHNGEYVDKFKANGVCNIKDISVSYDLSLLDEAKQNCFMRGDTQTCLYDSPSRVIARKNNAILTDIHIYPEERKYDPLKIVQIEITGGETKTCRSISIKRVECETYTSSQLQGKPVISQLGVSGIY